MFLPNRFLVNQIFLPNLRSFAQNHLALLKDRFLEKMLVERANPSSYPTETYQVVKKSLPIYKQFYFHTNTSSYSPCSLMNALILVATQIRAASQHFFTLSLPLKSCILKEYNLAHNATHHIPQTNRLCMNSTITGSISIFIGD